MKKRVSPKLSVKVRFHVREFEMPPIRDGLVLGKDSPIGCAAMRRALSLLHPASFDHLEFEDSVISDILVRSSILLKVPRDALLELVVTQLKPLMTAQEVLHFDLSVDMTIEAQLPCP